MAGNRRGKVKEQIEGIHSNLDWAQVHCEKALGIIAGDNEGLTTYFTMLIKEIKTIDEISKSVYATI